MITTNGVKQATYDGHPLYTYVGDTAPGQVKGNALNVSGGLWWVMTPTGAKVAAPGRQSVVRRQQLRWQQLRWQHRRRGLRVLTQRTFAGRD